MRNAIIEAIEKEKIIVVVRDVERECIIPLAQAMYDGGIRLLELTYSANGKTSDQDNAANIEMLAKYFEGRMHIGAGTVLTEAQVELTHKAGGGFIISPDTFGDVIKRTRELGMVSIPGALTPTEIREAVRCGADFIKLFPVTNLGTDYIKAIRAPLSDVKLLAVGGINESNMCSYLETGISGIGVGSNIVDKKLIQSGDYNGIVKLARVYTEKIK